MCVEILITSEILMNAGASINTVMWFEKRYNKVEYLLKYKKVKYLLLSDLYMNDLILKAPKVEYDLLSIGITKRYQTANSVNGITSGCFGVSITPEVLGIEIVNYKGYEGNFYNYNCAISGNYGYSESGCFESAVTGDYGTAIVGQYGYAIAGDGGKVIAKEKCRVAIGKNGMITAGRLSKAKAGYGSIIRFFQGVDNYGNNKYKEIKIGNDEFNPNIYYRINKFGKVNEVK